MKVVRKQFIVFVRDIITIFIIFIPFTIIYSAIALCNFSQVRMHSWIILKRLPLCNSSHSFKTRLFCSTHSNFEVSFFWVFSDLFLSLSKLLWTKHKKIPNGHWGSKENRIEYLNFLSRKLNIKTMEDWYRVTYNVK